MEQYRTELASMMERLHAQLGRPIVHRPHAQAKPIKIAYGPHLLKVHWLKTMQVWRVDRATGLAAGSVRGLGLLSDAEAVAIAKNIIRAATAPQDSKHGK